VLKAIDLIGRREGIGDLLAEGSRRAAMAIGRGSIAFAPQVKGLEIPGYEPRALQTMALGFAVGSRGADHNRSGAYEVDLSDKVDRRRATLDSVRYAIETEDRAALMDSLILCKFLRGVFSEVLRRSGGHAATRHRVGRHRGRTSRDGAANRRSQARGQRGVPAGRPRRIRFPSGFSMRRCQRRCRRVDTGTFAGADSGVPPPARLDSFLSARFAIIRPLVPPVFPAR
jgi:hypothetical protein